MTGEAPSSAQPSSDAVVVEDVLRGGLRVVFCGTALGAASARAHAYYAGPGNKFWPTLHRIGLTPTRLAPTEYRSVLDHGVGLTDLCKSRSGSDLEIGNDAFDVGRLIEQLNRYRPDWIAFNGKKAAKEALGLRAVGYGVREEGLGDSRVYVLPSTSGAASGHWDLGHWQRLADLIRRPA